MGGRGSSSGGGGGRAGGAGGTGGGASVQPTQNIQNQAPTPQNTPVVPNAATVISNMSDDQLAQLVTASKTIDMPNHLKDVSDPTQKFVYAAGMNGKPLVLDQAGFDKYIRDNNIPRSSVMSRTAGVGTYQVNNINYSLSPEQTLDMVRYSNLTYIGGKFGGQVHGAGTYFDMNGGRATGYGSGRTATAIAVLSPTARTISSRQLRVDSQQFANSHPKFAKAVGQFSNSNMSIYALAQGYNVITGGSYHNVIDRTAIVMLDKNI